MTPKGWACPVCGCVYAPWVSECSRCNAEPKSETQNEAGKNTDVEPSFEGTGIDENQNKAWFDPNQQCVDCSYGTVEDAPDGFEKVINCRIFGMYRSVQDTCAVGIDLAGESYAE